MRLHVVGEVWRRLTTAQRLTVMVVAFVVLATGALVSGSRAEPGSVGPSARPERVVIFGVPRLGLGDVGSGAMPNLDRLARQGAIAAATVRTLAPEPTTEEGYTTLGAGARVRADERAALSFAATDQVEAGTAGEALQRRTGGRVDGGVVVLGAPATVRLNQGQHVPSGPGALGDALRRSGLRTAAVGNADVAWQVGSERVRRPAPAAVMTAHGVVDTGAVGPSLLMRDPAAPFGARADRAAVVAAVEAALARAHVVIVDPGDIDRAAAFADVSTPALAAAARRQALAATDRLLGEVAALAGPRALLLVVAVTPPGTEWRLTPMVAAGAGVRPGYLHSHSTRRVGVVTLTDVAPTVLDALGAAVPSGMIGHPLRYRPGPADVALLRDTDRDALFRERFYFPLTVGFIAVQALVYLGAAVAFSRLGGVGRAGRFLRWIVLAVSAWPLATFLLRAIPNVADLGLAALGLLVAIDAVLVAVALRRPGPLGPLAWVCGATLGVLLLDVWTGARLQTSSLLGYSPYTAARFTGLGNAAFAILTATTVIAGCLHVHHAHRRREALVATGLLFALVALSDTAPPLGADVGGILTLVPVFGLVLLALTGRRLSRRAVALATGGAVLALAGVAAADVLRPPEARTHLGQLVARVLDDGWAPFATTIGRKVASNIRTSRSPWTWVVPIITAYMIWMLAWARGLSELLPRRSALRIAVAGTLAAGALGNVVNDSGVVVTALVFVYIGPFLTLLALEREQSAAPAAAAGTTTSAT
ncbi:MAG: hypothetical protein M3Q48_12915 [Actinomycetota bacterium]|nr:hypothetical protein [Actinomycetota bacterium]